MKRSVRLTLKKETLAALTADDMSLVGGAAEDSAASCYTCVIDPGCWVIAFPEPSLNRVTDCCRSLITCHRGAC